MANAESFFDAAELAALAIALPGRIQAATEAIAAAEQRLAHALMKRDSGRPMKISEIATARMALARTKRNLDDLKLVESTLPDLLDRARAARQPERRAVAAA